MSAANATDPTDSQSIERTSDPSESKLSTTQTTKLEKALKKDFHNLYVRQFTTTWEIERLVRDAEIEVMSFDNLTALIQSEASRIALEAIGEDDAPDVRIEEINGIEGEYDWSSPCNQLRAEQRTKLKALTAPEGGKHD